MPLALLFVATAGSGTAHAQPYPCSASTAGLISRDAGGTCADGLTLNEEFTLRYQMTNLSIIDDPGGPLDGTGVTAHIPAGEELFATLAQAGPLPGDTPMPGVLTWVPVCPLTSVGGTVAPGAECDPLADQCGNMECGCLSSVDGVHCHATADPNLIHIHFSGDVSYAANQTRTLASVRVRTTALVPPPAQCGQFFTRFDSSGDFMLTNDAQCETQVTAGAQASADLNAPECLVDADCGDPACNQCVDVGTNSHCETRPADTACTPDDNVCTDDICDANGTCTHVGVSGIPCDDDLFCTGGPSGDVCVDGICEGPPTSCNDSIACTADTCDENLNRCVHTPNDNLCDDNDTCTVDTCSVTDGCNHRQDGDCLAICRSPGYWATHSGYEKNGSVNVGQLVINQTGPLEICGQTITSTSNHTSPYLSGLGLSSDLEALCVRVEGIRQRQLYRQLVAAALNCAISGQDCDELTGRFIDVSFDDCNALCAGDLNASSPTIGQCIKQLDCFNNGGRIIDGQCATGTCEQSGANCTAGTCPDINGEDQTCVPFEDSCHDQPLCNLDIGVCPGKTPASSSRACNEARDNTCTIDSCATF